MQYKQNGKCTILRHRHDYDIVMMVLKNLWFLVCWALPIESPILSDKRWLIMSGTYLLAFLAVYRTRKGIRPPLPHRLGRTFDKLSEAKKLVGTIYVLIIAANENYRTTNNCRTWLSDPCAEILHASSPKKICLLYALLAGSQLLP